MERGLPIDRSRFLLLASAMAGGACASNPPSSTPVATVASASTSAEPAPEPQKPPKYSKPTYPSTEYPAAEASMPRYYGPADEGGSYGSAKPKPQRAFNRGQCTGDDVGAPAACSTIKEDASCAPFPFVGDACGADLSYLKPRIAERAIGCMRALGPKKLCDAMNVYDCRDQALRSACADPAVDAICAGIVQKCAIAIDDCRGYLAGMNDAGRAAVTKCLSNASSCRWGIWSCIEGL
jgi:hypothetical protein